MATRVLPDSNENFLKIPTTISDPESVRTFRELSKIYLKLLAIT